MKAGKTIIPIASGKGGVGKTFLSANLAIALAEMGYPTIAVDMDLGGSNLHSYLGLPNRYPGIGDFIKARIAELEDLLISTGISNLQFLPGEGQTPFLANIPHAQKVRLISRIRALPAEYIILDLGAGTSYNTLDYFRLSSHGIVITTPEYPSIMGMLTFLKHFIFRSVVRTFAKDQQIREALRLLFKQPMSDGKMSMEALRSGIAAIDPKAGEKVKRICNWYRPRIVFSMGEHPSEIGIAKKISSSMQSVLSMDVDYFGFVFDDPLVRQSVKKQIPFFPQYRESMAAEGITQMAHRIVKFMDKRIKDSARLLEERTRKLYEKRA